MGLLPCRRILSHLNHWLSLSAGTAPAASDKRRDACTRLPDSCRAKGRTSQVAGGGERGQVKGRGHVLGGQLAEAVRGPHELQGRLCAPLVGALKRNRISGETHRGPRRSCTREDVLRGISRAGGFVGFPGGSDGKKSACRAGDLGSTSGSGRSPGGGHGNPLQYPCLEHPMRRGAWRATVHGVANSWTQQSD